MIDYIISAQYGELVEGWRESRIDLQREISRGELADPRVIADLNRECQEWAEVMVHCPMFVECMA